MRPAETIPKPHNPSRRVLKIDGDSESLARQMRLDGNKNKLKLYFDIVNSTGMLCDQYFPFNEKMSGGWNVKPILRVLVPKLLKKFPVLRNYVDLWPITTMISRHHALCKAGSKKGIIRSASWQSNVIKPTVGGNLSTPNTYTRCMNTRNMFTRSMKAPGYKDAAGRSHKLCYSQDIARRKGTGSNGYNDDDWEASPLPSSPRAPTSEGPPSVVHFLSTLAQDLSALLPVFIDHGVEDDASLRNMLRMNNWRAWMYAWVKEGVLTELQFQMVIDGLKKLA
ncbi:hypothetical protein LXA43DRAFT_1058162 [Ganoderma leucocontextum]|nr:hypothetical protein LXA43DRAFT_1058162 [Ganoderma leucocontextum]